MGLLGRGQRLSAGRTAIGYSCAGSRSTAAGLAQRARQPGRPAMGERARRGPKDQATSRRMMAEADSGMRSDEYLFPPRLVLAFLPARRSGSPGGHPRSKSMPWARSPDDPRRKAEKGRQVSTPFAARRPDGCATSPASSTLQAKTCDEQLAWEQTDPWSVRILPPCAVCCPPRGPRTRAVCSLVLIPACASDLPARRVPLAPGPRC